MQNPKRASYCSTIRSEMVFRHSYPGTYNPIPSNKEPIQKPQVNVEKIRRLSNTSLSSHDSGVGFTKTDYEIQRAIRAQRVQRPHIIVLHKGKPISNTLNNHDEFEANIVVAAATASKRNRREISVMQKRQTIISTGNDYDDNMENFKQFSRLKNNSAPNLYQTTQTTMKIQNKSQEQKKNKEIKSQLPKIPLFMPKYKSLFKSVSLSIKKLIGIDEEKKRHSQLIKQIHHQPKFF
ncbi:hypothetical protein C1645_779443 [Glomus cerebriforme]|uniref:Uncharacterized protein n=1 Tax=Glomus cerebriforme TaxID=658196 RepID=A0A397SUK0_9GLOM|nr:hypothetical protein C1645_779443 [Glomus cerebriforme]